MEGFLSDARIKYVIYHLRNHVVLSDQLINRFVFSRDSSKVESGKIIFTLSSAPLIIDRVFQINSTPILFPVADKKEFYSIDDTGTLTFEHDILKSVFYLLSGYQEYTNKTSQDKFKRFAFEDSIQHKLTITSIPVVNYYFDIICEALEKFSQLHKLEFKRNRLFPTFGFQLSHDIDRVDLYNIPYIGYKLKEIVGLAKTPLSLGANFKLLISGTLKYLSIIKNDNPYWNFEFLRKLERIHNFRSIFFFLDQGVKHADAYYSFQEDRVKELFNYLQEEDCEIGLHGPVKSLSSQEVMNSSLAKLKEASQAPVIGNRQHRLLWTHPDTAIIESKCGLQYDSTLGFAAHEGFRNSYCYPFRIFDFATDTMLDVWEFPLTVMDGTLLGYRNLSNEEALQKCKDLIQEIKKFGGLFTLLWHNSFFDEDVYPGVQKLYEDILTATSEQKPECLLGHELLSRMKNLTAAYD
jgi:hypothetical protein